jgi:hypothetical protein
MAAHDPFGPPGSTESQAHVPGDPSLTGPETGIQAASPSETAIQAGTPHGADEEKIHLPPRPAPQVRREPLSPARLAVEIGKLDRVIAALLLLLAFFLGSFAVQNSDFWMHLATGRLLAQGDYHFGEDPFSFHQGDAYWVNHAWLYDWATYGLAALAGGIDSPVAQAVLVVCKALLAVALAWVLLCIRRPGQSLWVPALTTALAMLALSPRLLLNPLSVSLLFLGLTVYLTLKRGMEPEGAGASGGLRAFLAAKPAWLLPPLFVLWVNVDSWFILGPLTVGLFLVGELLQHYLAPVSAGPDEPEPGRLRTLALVLAAGLVACFISPFHYHSFTLPTEGSQLLAQGSDWAENQIGITLPIPDQVLAAGRALETWLHAQPTTGFSSSDSPLTAPFFVPAEGLNVTGLAYFVLLAAGLVSFGLAAFSAGLWRWVRFLPWLAFALLSVHQARLIPFFAVVGGAVAALNIQDLVAYHFGTGVRTTPSWKAWSLGGRLATVLAGILLLVFDWPGKLHGRADKPRSTHRVAWHVVPDPVLERTALQLRDACGQGGVKHGFNFDHELTAYCAWYCPQERLAFDTRFALFPDRIKDYLQVRDALATGQAAVWQKFFRKQGIDHVIVGGREGLGPRTLLTLRQIWVNPREWAQPGVGDISFIAGWKDPSRDRLVEPFAIKPLDLDALAFRQGTTNRAPAESVPFNPDKRGFLADFTEPLSPSPWDAEAAAIYGRRLEFDVNLWAVLNREWVAAYVWASRMSLAAGVPAAGAVGAAVGLPYMMPISANPTLLIFDQRHLMALDNLVSKAPAVLAVRAARRAVAANPQDAYSQLALAKSYIWLWNTQEDVLVGTPRLGPLTLQRLRSEFRRMMRVVQVMTALNRAVTLRPELREAHLLLYRMYQRLHYVDLALHHMEEWARLEEEQPPIPRAPREAEQAFKQRRKNERELRKNRQTALKRYRDAVKERYNTYKIDAVDKSLQQKLEIALVQPYQSETERDSFGRGLAKEGLDLLLKAKGREKDPGLALMQLNLLLTTGRAQDFRAGLEEFELWLKKATASAKPNAGLDLSIAEMLRIQVLQFKFLLATADGDYAAAEQRLEELRRISQRTRKNLKTSVRNFLHGLIFYLSLQNQPLARLIFFYSGGPQKIAELEAQLVALLVQPAVLNELIGLLALEEGDVAKAADSFRQCLRHSRDLGGRFTDGLIVQTYLRIIDRQNRQPAGRARK